ncbi:hypothetical protein HTSR_0723 [Halodesulfurarchaeum formicicum]|uniref:DUF2064 domain-containing protein n=1 Tax=Halodesulfurarchaeum formicicum TaxID=1873524 RepID=A0A1D8S3I7_9EURY|nr:hypothetical protein [Halodesulfurarchaeum formicicum]AOW79913.1 hypothetical protein HTSR_0723 [Halodesulfurarchaeum formicicum]APE95206.1 hypothetical protein HSR6_0749 [Halodesulfurarchaeum formicicum]
MTTVVLVADPPVEGIACQRLLEETELTPADGLELYRALLGDTMETLARSTIDILVNYPTAEGLPAGADPEADLREIAAEAMSADRLADVRFEPQVGSNFSAIAGNAITHLVRDEGRQSAAALRPCVPRLARSVVDEATLNLRRDDVILGPAARGDVYFAGFAEPIDFEDAFETRPIEELTRRATEADLDVGFVQQRTVLDSPADFRTVRSRIEADHLAGKPVPERFWNVIQERGIEVEDGVVQSAETA